MKKYILLPLILIFSFLSYSQEYPKIEKDSTGTYVIFTFEQAQIIDNKLELLNLLQESNLSMNQLDSICIKTIDDKDQIINSQTIHIEALNESIKNRDDIIENRDKAINDFQIKYDLLNQKNDNLNEMIILKDEQIKKMKTRNIIIGTVGGVVITTGIAFLIYSLVK